MAHSPIVVEAPASRIEMRDRQRPIDAPGATSFECLAKLRRSLGFAALQAGLAFLPMTVIILAVAMLISRLLHRVG